MEDESVLAVPELNGRPWTNGAWRVAPRAETMMDHVLQLGPISQISSYFLCKIGFMIQPDF